MDDIIASSSPEASSALDWLASVRRREQSLHCNSLYCPETTSSRKTTFAPPKTPLSSAQKPQCNSKKHADPKNASSLPSQARTLGGALVYRKCVEKKDASKGKKRDSASEEREAKQWLFQENPQVYQAVHSLCLQRDREKRVLHTQRKQPPASSPSPPERADNGAVFRREFEKSDKTTENRLKASKGTARGRDNGLRKVLDQGFPGVPDLPLKFDSKCSDTLRKPETRRDPEREDVAFPAERTVVTLWRIPHHGDRTIAKALMPKSAGGLLYRVLSGGEVVWFPIPSRTNALCVSREGPFSIQPPEVSRILKEMSQNACLPAAGNTLLFSASCQIHRFNNTERSTDAALHFSGTEDQGGSEDVKTTWEKTGNATLLEHAIKAKRLPPSSSNVPIAACLYTSSSSTLLPLCHVPAPRRSSSSHLAHPKQKASDLLHGPERVCTFSHATITHDGSKSSPSKTAETHQKVKSSQPLTATDAHSTNWQVDVEKDMSEGKDHESNGELCLCEVALSASTTAGTSESTQSSSFAGTAEIFSQPSLASLVKFAGRATRVEGRQRMYRNTSTVLGHGFSGDVKIFKHRKTQEVFALKTVLNEEERMQRGWRFCSWRGRRTSPGSCPEGTLLGDSQKSGKKGNGKTQRNVGSGENVDTLGDPAGQRVATDADNMRETTESTGRHAAESRRPRGCGGEATRGKPEEPKTTRKKFAKAEEKDKEMKRDLQAIMGEGVYACLSADHPAIIKLVEFIEDDEGVHLIMPVCKGGPLSRASLRKLLGPKSSDPAMTLHSAEKLDQADGDVTAFSPWQSEKTEEERRWKSWERVAKKFTWQILKALRHLHTQGIIHRDVKAQNFLLVEPSHPRLLLIDFGFSLFTSTNALNHPDEGTFSELKERILQSSKSGQETSRSGPSFSQQLHPPQDLPYLPQTKVNPETPEPPQEREKEDSSPPPANATLPPRNPTKHPSAAAVTYEERSPELKRGRCGNEMTPRREKNHICLGESAAKDAGELPPQTGGKNPRREELPFTGDAYFLSCMTRNTWRGPSALLSKRIVGTPGLHPPEVLRHTSYTPATDMWGLGLVINALLTGTLMPGLASSGNLLFDEMHDRVLSPACRDFLERCLRRRQKLRITATEALFHPWLQEERQAEDAKIRLLVHCAQNTDSSIHKMIDNLRSFPLQSLFHRLFYLLLAYALPPSEVPEEVEVLFYAFDKSKRGMVFYDDFVSTLKTLDLSIRNPEALEIFTSMYTSTRTVYSSQGCCLHQAVHALEFTPFLAGVMDKQVLLHANSLRRIFCRLDPSRKGTVAVSQVISLLGSEGRLRDELRHYLEDMGIEARGSFSFEDLAIALAKKNGLRTIGSSSANLVRQQAILSPPGERCRSSQHGKNVCSSNCLGRLLLKPLSFFSASLSPRGRKRREGTKGFLGGGGLRSERMFEMPEFP
ncbi:protein kinase (incomplete catalytic triad) [Toxoplasma gondii TgCatPRC2]|uniref:Protein kinase (Incomplete catalytic triad) n=1 Tax=Toxoplasma gondii TgCatPRC2 TaxID=1130821 RepID=A0A151HHF3_TOXGO|nr:protein kinase (incomplete catalytic triad) [Toxoplasma gondii TgCatPRC2]